MELIKATVPVLFLCLIGGVFGIQYCSTVTRGKVTSISCGDHYHCCDENTKCCPDPGYISNGAIAGIAVGGAVAVVVIICLTICFVKSRQHKKKTMVNVDVGNTDIGSIPRSDETAGYDQRNPDDLCTIPPPYTENGGDPPKYAK